MEKFIAVFVSALGPVIVDSIDEYMLSLDGKRAAKITTSKGNFIALLDEIIIVPV